MIYIEFPADLNLIALAYCVDTGEFRVRHFEDVLRQNLFKNTHMLNTSNNKTQNIASGYAELYHFCEYHFVFFFRI